MSSDSPVARADNAGVIRAVLGGGLRRIDRDLDRMGAALRRANPAANYLPVAAIEALDAANAHAGELRKQLTALRLIRHPARSHAIEGLDNLVAGLTRLRRIWVSYAEPSARVSPDERNVTQSLGRARAELLAADRALGCPWGCPEPPPKPKIPKFGTKPKQ